MGLNPPPNPSGPRAMGCEGGIRGPIDLTISLLCPPEITVEYVPKQGRDQRLLWSLGWGPGLLALRAEGQGTWTAGSLWLLEASFSGDPLEGMGRAQLPTPKFPRISLLPPEPPKIHLDFSGKTSENTIVVVAGNKLRLDVSITGEPPPVATWMKEDEVGGASPVP